MAASLKRTADEALAVVPPSAVPATTTSAAAPRKRRRRTTASGAQEDCFTCRNRGIRCDRKRPYCTQCQDIGKDCSGYRTTLTWGVGVASRGKLRGLSLPIANSAKAAQSPCCEKQPPLPAPVKRDMASPPKPVEQPVQIKTEQLPLRRVFSPSRTPSHAGFVGDVLQHSPAISIPSSTIPTGWPTPGFREHLEGYNGFSARPNRIQARPRSLSRVHSAGNLSFSSIPYDDPIFSAPSTASFSTFSERSEFPSPNEVPRTPEQASLNDPVIGSYDSQHYAEILPMYMNNPSSSLDFAAPFSMPGCSLATPGFATEHVPQLSCDGYLTSPPAPSNVIGSNAFSDIFYMDDFNASMSMGQPSPMTVAATPQSYSHPAHEGHAHRHSIDYTAASPYLAYDMPAPYVRPAIPPPGPVRHHSVPNIHGLGLQWPSQPSPHLHQNTCCS